MRTPKRRQNNAVNAGSMADIAFMLLIFFLVTTTMDTDQGITVKLPPWVDVAQPPPPISKRNIFMINLNAADELLVRGEYAMVSGLKEKCKDFVLNPTKNPAMASAPNKAVIAIKSDRNTSYHAYIQVYDQIRSAYTEMWNVMALNDYGVAYSEDLPNNKRIAIRRKLPFVVSESESTDYLTGE